MALKDFRGAFSVLFVFVAARFLCCHLISFCLGNLAGCALRRHVSNTLQVFSCVIVLENFEFCLCKSLTCPRILFLE